eukprot:m.346130 g.346130  ORF g.346130 m.346130 type:complete len:340 (+) comp20666_c0_seq72:1349-2368(+)
MHSTRESVGVVNRMGNLSSVVVSALATRVSLRRRSYERFMSDYAMPGIPVVITNGVPDAYFKTDFENAQEQSTRVRKQGTRVREHPSAASERVFVNTPKPASTRWTLSYIAERCDRNATVVPRVPEVNQWAGLSPLRSRSNAQVLLAEFLQKHAAPPTQNDTHSEGYLFDYSLNTGCPALAQELVIPKYFARDMLQRIPPESLPPTSYRDFWPSLFVGRGGATGSDMHIDAWCSNFYMMMLQGRKRWFLFPPEDSVRLYRNHITGTFSVNSTAFDVQEPRHESDLPRVTLTSGVRLERESIQSQTFWRERATLQLLFDCSIDCKMTFFQIIAEHPMHTV